MKTNSLVNIVYILSLLLLTPITMWREWFPAVSVIVCGTIALKVVWDITYNYRCRRVKVTNTHQLTCPADLMVDRLLHGRESGGDVKFNSDKLAESKEWLHKKGDGLLLLAQGFAIAALIVVVYLPAYYWLILLLQVCSVVCMSIGTAYTVASPNALALHKLYDRELVTWSNCRLLAKLLRTADKHTCTVYYTLSKFTMREPGVLGRRLDGMVISLHKFCRSAKVDYDAISQEEAQAYMALLRKI